MHETEYLLRNQHVLKRVKNFPLRVDPEDSLSFPQEAKNGPNCELDLSSSCELDLSSSQSTPRPPILFLSAQF